MSEDAIQRAIASYLDVALPPDCFYTAVNPKPFKSKAAAGISKAMGMKAGVPDIVLCASGRFVGIEVKQEGKYLEKVQKAVHEQIGNAGGKCFTVRSIDDVEDVLNELGIEKRGTAA